LHNLIELKEERRRNDGTNFDFIFFTPSPKTSKNTRLMLRVDEERGGKGDRGQGQDLYYETIAALFLAIFLLVELLNKYYVCVCVFVCLCVCIFARKGVVCVLV